jgi:oligopeptide/dipeptide ABC transporter ATP-binding protein
MTMTYTETSNGFDMPDEQEAMVRVENLTKYFPIKAGVFSKVKGFVRAVDGISLSIAPRETYGLVGESGSGKTTLGWTILRMHEPTSGRVFFQGVDLAELKKGEMRRIKRNMQIIFQDPYGSLNPRMGVGEAIGEALGVHGIANKKKRREMVEYTLDVCGLAPYHYSRYPHEFSGGQRQRIVIARALVLQPVFIVADEPVSALDVSIQSQIINLLEELQEEFGLTYLFISHDLNVVKHISDRVGVMYLGTLVEEAPKKIFYQNPQHPYTRSLISALPVTDPSKRKQRIILKGDIPSPANPPPGCRFHTRCPQVMEICRKIIPELVEVSPGHKVACHLVME